MKIAIHYTEESWSFSSRWINYCKENDIPYKIVNAYDTDIVQQVDDCTAFMWHFSNYEHKDSLFAKQLIYSLEQKGLKVFPNFKTCWHFDDKVGQKYLLEAISSPLVSSYVFYDKKEALEWVNKTIFPKVFKLRGGSGSSNVKLVNTKKEAIHLINKAFGKGFPQFDRWNHLKFRYKNYKTGKEDFNGILKGIARLFIGTKYSKKHQRETGYVYFQDFIPNNKYDIRICVVGNKAFGLKRLIRKDDFRASGSGNIIYNKQEIDERCVQIAFNINEKIKAQSIAFDFVFNEKNNPLILEISYGFDPKSYDICEGYWTQDMQWHKGTFFNFCGWMVEQIL